MPAMIYPSVGHTMQAHANQDPLTIEKPLELPLDDPSTTDQESAILNLIVYNDNVNTFEYVIDTLIRICKHYRLQAEQCTYIIHFKGKCIVKKGNYQLLKPMRDGVTEAGISAEIV